MPHHQDQSHSYVPSPTSMLAATVKTLGMASVGTGLLVVLHHKYRKQHNAQAQLQDYVLGAKVQLKRLHHANMQAANNAQQAWLTVWQQGAEIVAEQPRTESVAKVRVNKNSHTLQQEVLTGAQQKVTSPTSHAQVATTSIPTSHTAPKLEIVWVSGVAELSKGEFAVVGIAANASKDILWQTSMPERVHDIVVQPVNIHKSEAKGVSKRSVDGSQHVVVMGRRPSEHFWVLNVETGDVIYRIKAEPQRHFYGHACFSLDGQTLYVTENDTVSLMGKIGVYAVNQQYKKVAEFATYGIGPHELLAHPDDETLVIANGGIKTEKASREELNLDSMQPSLVYLNRHDGCLLEQVYPEHNQMSVRHLSLHPDGLVAIGIQFQGERYLNMPLVLTHRRGDAQFTALSMPHGQWQCFHHYIASVAINANANLLCASSPIGGCTAVYDLSSGQMIQSVKLPDCAGVAVALAQAKQTQAQQLHEGFIVSDGQGRLTQLTVDDKQSQKAATQATSASIEPLQVTQVCHPLAFDNHLQAVAYPEVFSTLVTQLAAKSASNL